MHAHTHARARSPSAASVYPSPALQREPSGFQGREGWTALRISQPSSRSARSTTIKILLPLEEGQESKFTAVHVSPPPASPLFLSAFSLPLLPPPPPLEDAREEKLTALRFLLLFFFFANRKPFVSARAPSPPLIPRSPFFGEPPPPLPPFKTRRRNKTATAINYTICQFVQLKRDRPPRPPSTPFLSSSSLTFNGLLFFRRRDPDIVHSSGNLHQPRDARHNAD